MTSFLWSGGSTSCFLSMSLSAPNRVRCCFAPPSVWNPQKLGFGYLCRFPHILMDFQSMISVGSVTSFQSLSVIFNHFESSENAETCCQPEGGGKTTLKSRDLTAMKTCDSNHESQIASDLRQREPPEKCSTLWLEAHKSARSLKRVSNHNSRDSDLLYEPHLTAIWWRLLRCAICDLEHLGMSCQLWTGSHHIGTSLLLGLASAATTSMLAEWGRSTQVGSCDGGVNVARSATGRAVFFHTTWSVMPPNFGR